MKILLVEDNTDHRELMRLALTEHDFTWEVEEAASGEEALRLLLRGEIFDLVFLDYSLPGRDGLDVLEDIRRSKSPPPVVVTSRGDEQVAVRAMRGGAYDYVVKGKGYLQRLPVVAQRAVDAHQSAVAFKRAEKALRESEERLRTTVEASLDAIIAVNVDGRLVLFNGAAQELFQYSEEEALNQPVEILMREEKGKTHQKRLERFLKKGVGQCGHIGRRMEKIFRRKDGSLFEAEVSMSGGRLDGLRLVVLAIHDITARKQAEETLRQVGENFRRSLDDSPLGVCIVTQNGDLIYVNRTMLDFDGCDSIEEFKKTPLNERYTPQSLAEREMRREKRKRGKYEPSEYDVSVVMKNGEVRHLHVFRKDIVWDGERQYVVLYNDITEQKHAEEEAFRRTKNIEFLSETAMSFVELPAGSDLYRFIGDLLKQLVGEANCILINSIDTTTRKTQLSALIADDQYIQAVSKILGEDPMGMSFVLSEAAWDGLITGKIVHVSDGIYGLLFAKIPKDACDLLEKVAEMGEIFAIGFTKKEELYGSAIIIMRKGSDLRNRDVVEAFVRQAGIALQRKRTEEALRKAEEKYRNIFENSAEGLYQVNPKGRFTTANPAAARILGYESPEELISMITDIGSQVYICPEDREKALQLLRKDGSFDNFEVQNRQKNGNLVWVIASVHVVRDDQGNILYHEGTSRDITERKLTEDALHTSLREKDLLLREIHHRVKNSLQVISGLLDLQSSSSRNPELTERLQESQRRIRSMAMIHERLYDANDLSNIDLAGYVKALSQELLHLHKINPEGIELVIQTDGDVYIGINKAIPCGLILNELISNALKHAFPGDETGELRIIIHETKNIEMEIVVRDNGLGLPDDIDMHQPRSVGLYLVNGLVKNQLDGQIEVRRGAGTEFRITFPL